MNVYILYGYIHATDLPVKELKRILNSKFPKVMLTLRHSLYCKHLKKHQLKMDIWYLKIEEQKIKQLEIRINRTFG